MCRLPCCWMGTPDVWSGALKPENVPNILFLGCGFQSEDEDTFWLVADTIVHKLKRDPLLQPFGYLATSMNYWRLMVSAPEAGVSVRCAVQQFTEGGRLFAKRVRAPVEPPPKATDWELQHLIYMAGLPVPADLNLVEDTAPPGGAPANADAVRDIPITRLNLKRLFDRWAATMRLDFPQEMINAIKKDVVKQWLAMADRTFIDEVNNFPAIMAGVPPTASFNDTALLAYHNLRGTIGDERVAFFRRVRAAPRNGISITLDDSNGQAPELGNLWAEQRPGFAFDNRPFIVALSNTPYGHANFREMGVQTCLSLTGRGADGTSFEMTIPVARATGRNALMLQLPRGDLSLRSPTWRVCAHELAHAFGLGDEYARIRQRRTGQESELNDYANLMFEAGARVDGESEKINFGLIKWNWHRIRKACVLTLPIQQNLDGTFLVFVRKGSGLQFAVGDMVRLRRRVKGAVINRDPVTSLVEFRVEAIHKHNINNSQDPFNMTVVLKNDAPVIDVDPFEPGSIVYEPIPSPAPVNDILRRYLTLVSPAAELIMTKIGGTMTGVACDIDQQIKQMEEKAGVQAPILPEDLKISIPSNDLPEVVGVYFGGGQYACGVLHPTGTCMMRNDHDDATKFCAVCRYALVEYIDPDQHWAIDRDYDKKYWLS